MSSDVIWMKVVVMKFRSESVFPDRVYINGKEEKTDLKMQEYKGIPYSYML